jgi:alpha-1,2-mannosyltransferase
LFGPLCPPVVFSIATGQNGALSAALLGTGLALTVRHPVPAGIAFGLLSYKPQLALVVPFCLLAGRHFRTLGVMMATVLGLIVLSLFCFGLEPWLAFPDGVARQGGEVFVQVPANWARMPTLLTLARQLGGGTVTVWAVQMAGAVVAAVVAAWVWRHSMEPAARVLALTAATLLATPYAWDYDTAILVLPLALLVWQGWKQGFSWGLVAVVMGLWMMGLPLSLLSRAVGFQLGPLLWLGLLGYAVYLTRRYRRKGRQLFQTKEGELSQAEDEDHTN